MTTEMRDRCRRTIEKGKRRKKRNAILRALRRMILAWLWRSFKKMLPIAFACVMLFGTVMAWALNNEKLFSILTTLALCCLILLFAFWITPIIRREE